MKHQSAPGHAPAPRSTIPELQAAEDEAFRLLGGCARDPLSRIAVAFDLHIRRLAYRLAAALKPPGRGSTSSR